MQIRANENEILSEDKAQVTKYVHTSIALKNRFRALHHPNYLPIHSIPKTITKISAYYSKKFKLVNFLVTSELYRIK